jgi:hypothetical protein
MGIKGLWPTDLIESTGDTPEDILQVQARDLTEKTRGMIEGRIEKGSQGDWVILDLLLVVPSLDDYAYQLLKIRHKVPAYPLEIIEGAAKTTPARSRQEFEGALARIFASDATRRTIGDLMAYAKKPAMERLKATIRKNRTNKATATTPRPSRS